MSKRCLGCMEEMEEQTSICPFCGYEEGTPAKEAYHMVPGTILHKRYLVGRALGFGGFGVTYIGYDLVLRVAVGIKEYLPGEFATRIPNEVTVTIYTGEKGEQFLAGKDKFIEEARKLAKFQKVPGIVGIYDSFEENNTAYIVMEYLKGETLKERLERENRLKPEEAVRITREILTALDVVHQDGIIHRDIAPDNIYLTEENQIKLLDFGAARFATSKHTRSLSIMVKPGYSPEEQYQSHGDQGPWTDVYAVAATCYRMLTGQLPEDSMERGIKDSLRPPSKKGVKIPKTVETAIMNALHVKPEDRTRSAREFLDELSAAQVKAKRVTKEKRDLGKWPLWLKVVLGTAAMGIGVFFLLLTTDVFQFDISAWSQAAVEEGKIRIPSFINDTMDEALVKGESLGVGLRTTAKEYSDQVPEGRVLRQSPEAGQTIEKGEDILVTISAGIEQTYVPDVTGFSEEKALEMLLDYGLEAEVTRKEGNGAPCTVAAQSIAPDTVLDTGGKITLTISLGKTGLDTGEEIKIPDLVGKEFSALQNKMIGQYGFYIEKEEEEAKFNGTEGEILSQQPAAGQAADRGTVIKVKVCRGPDKVIVPDVTYQPWNEAEEVLRNLGLEADREDEYSDQVLQDTVFGQSAEGNSLAYKGSSVTLKVSMGPEPEPETEPETQSETRRQRQTVAPTQPRQAVQPQGGNMGDPRGPGGGGETEAQPQETAPVPQETVPADGGNSNLMDIINNQEMFQ